MLFPAKNKIQTINEVEEIVNNGKVKITPDDWYALVYAAYQINAIQDLVSTGFKGNAIKNISVRSGAVTSDGSPTFDFTFTYQGSDGQEVTTTATAEIPVSTIPSTPGAEGAVGPKGDSVFIKYSANADGTGFTNSWTEGQSYIGIAVAQIEPADKTGYSWTKFIDKRITGLRFNGTNLIFTWSEGPETTVTMQTSDFKTVKPVEGVVTSVDGLTGAVNIGDINTIFEDNKKTAKEATVAKQIKGTVLFEDYTNPWQGESKEIVLKRGYRYIIVVERKYKSIIDQLYRHSAYFTLEGIADASAYNIPEGSAGGRHDNSAHIIFNLFDEVDGTYVTSTITLNYFLYSNTESDKPAVNVTEYSKKIADAYSSTDLFAIAAIIEMEKVFDYPDTPW